MSYLKFKDQAVNILTKALKYEDLCRLRADLLGVIQKQVSGGTLERCGLAMVYVYIQESLCINHIITLYLVYGLYVYINMATYIRDYYYKSCPCTYQELYQYLCKCLS